MRLNYREGFRRVLILLAIASIISIGTTVVTWLQWKAAEATEIRAMDYAESKRGGPEAESAAERHVSAFEETMRLMDVYDKVIGWTIVGHLMAIAGGILIWVVAGFFGPAKPGNPTRRRRVIGG